MELAAFIVAIVIIVVTGYFLYKKTNPQGLLLLSGLLMAGLGHSVRHQPFKTG